ADRHAAAARRGLAQLPADGVVAGSQDRCGDRVTPGGASPFLRHVDRVRGRNGALYPYGPGAARRDGHVRPGLALELTARHCPVEPSQQSRALAVNPPRLDILERTGVTSRMLARGLRPAARCNGSSISQPAYSAERGRRTACEVESSRRM